MQFRFSVEDFCIDSQKEDWLVDVKNMELQKLEPPIEQRFQDSGEMDS